MRMKISSIFLIAISVLLISTPSYGQGCSDAGFCTLNGMNGSIADSSHISRSQLKVGITLGKADHDITTLANYFEYSHSLKKASLDVKITSLMQAGNGITMFGVSDAFVSTNVRVSEKIDASAGFKLPLSDAGKRRNNFPLPMDYQSSLGTLDLILGIGLTFRKLRCAAGLQYPITQNQNEFLASDYPSVQVEHLSSRLNSRGEVTYCCESHIHFC